jgi:hypothetical protein
VVGSGARAAAASWRECHDWLRRRYIHVAVKVNKRVHLTPNPFTAADARPAAPGWWPLLHGPMMASFSSPSTMPIFPPHAPLLARRLVPALALSLAFSLPARAAAPEDIAAVVERFRTAIIAHDGATLTALFLPKHSSWLSLPTEAEYAAIRARHPDAPRVMPGSVADFAHFVSTSKHPVEERFRDVRILTNGTVATVYFDFDFLIDGKVENRGSETWQLVHTDAGWKICAMLYSDG